MVAGAFDKEIRIYRTVTTTTDGETTTTEPHVADVWASVLPQSGREYYRASQVHATMTHVVRIYYSPEVSGVKPTYWLTLGTRRLNIVSATNVDEESEFIDMVCVEVTAD